MLTLPCSAVAAAVAQVAMVALAVVEEVGTMGRTKGSTWLRAAPALSAPCPWHQNIATRPEKASRDLNRFCANILPCPSRRPWRGLRRNGQFVAS